MPMRRKSTEEDTSQLDKSEDECGDSGTRDSNDDSMYVVIELYESFKMQFVY